MASYKVFISFAVLVACIFAAHAAEEDLNAAPQQGALPVPESAVAPGAPEAAKDGHQRDKKFALYPGYAAYGYAAPAVIPAAIPAVSSYAYSYQKAVPYAYSASYYPGYYPYLF